MNYFTLFSLPVAFHIDKERLDDQFRELQKRYHPDNATHTAELDVAATQINQGYQILKNPDSRAAYLLELQQQTQGLEASIADRVFLNDAMQLRMDLDDASNTHHLDDLIQAVTTRVDQNSRLFAQAYQTQDWQSAIFTTQKLKFLVKLQADIQAAYDKFDDPSQLEDSFYV